MTYDPNGNIRSLHRYDGNSFIKHNLEYRYWYEEVDFPTYNNRLQSIPTTGSAFAYNEIGETTFQRNLENDELFVDYDPTGKVVAVFADGNHAVKKTEYLYDDRGFRLAKVTYSEDDSRTTWYVRDASGSVISIYEQEGEPANEVVEPVVQVEIPIYGSGKLATYYPVQDSSVSYEITDHLGNVRALLREDVMEFTATMEDNNQPNASNPRVREMQWFQNLFETELDDANKNVTSAQETVVSNPSKSAYLFWQDGVQDIEASDKAIGPALAREVRAGDIITAEAFALYEEKTSYTNSILPVTLASLLGQNFTSFAGLDGILLTQATQGFQNASGLFGQGQDSPTAPSAHLSYVVFDENMIAIDQDRVQVSTDAGFEPAESGLPHTHQRIHFDNPIVIAPEGKYIYIWVGNESENTKVWFDDVRITVSSTFVAQATDYGVWGEVLREQKRNALDRYKYAYQGQFAEKDFETGWNHFELREYESEIGRWTSNDPARQFWSPYVSMGNNPVGAVDPSGAYSWAGALWRSGFGLRGGIYQSGTDDGRPVWGFNTSSGSHFGSDAGSFFAGGQFVLDRAADINALRTLSIPDYVMYKYGGNGIDYDPLGQLTFAPGTGKAFAIPTRAMLTVAGRIGIRLIGTTAARVAGQVFGEVLGELGIPQYYIYVSGQTRIFVARNAMKHLEERAANALAKRGPNYLSLITQIHKNAINSAIDDVLSRGPYKFDTMYYSGGNEIMFGAPRTATELPAVIHFR